MGTMMTVTFKNNTMDKTFRRGGMHWSDSLLTGITQQPGETLAPLSTGTLTFEQGELGILGDGAGQIDLLYTCDAFAFGVLLDAGGQPLGLGPRPYWRVLGENFADPAKIDMADLGWSKEKYHAEPYTWANPLGLTITASPTSTHTTLSVEVNIDNAAPTRA